MRYQSLIGALALASALCTAASDARAFDDASYPDWSGSWIGIGGGNYDPSKPKGLGQQTPLKPEFQAILETSLADIAAGGQGNDPGYRCGSHGMPRVMIANVPIYFVIMPETTYIILERLSQVRRVYTDGRSWPGQLPGSSIGYSVGKWLSQDGGFHSVLEIETRGINGTRTYDSSGAPLDDGTVVKERISLDKADRNVLRNEITTIDNALTRLGSGQIISAHARACTVLLGVQPTCRHRPRRLPPERGWPADAGQEGPAGAGFAVF